MSSSFLKKAVLLLLLAFPVWLLFSVAICVKQLEAPISVAGTGDITPWRISPLGRLQADFSKDSSGLFTVENRYITEIMIPIEIAEMTSTPTIVIAFGEAEFKYSPNQWMEWEKREIGGKTFFLSPQNMRLPVPALISQLPVLGSIRNLNLRDISLFIESGIRALLTLLLFGGICCFLRFVVGKVAVPGKVAVNPVAVLWGAVALVFAANLLLPTQWNGLWAEGFSLWGFDKAGTEYWQTRVELHKSLSVFGSRIVTTVILDMACRFLNIPYLYAFIIIGFIFLVVCGYFLIEAGRCINLTERQISLGLLAFYFSFCTFFMMVLPLYTYDDPLQFVFLFAATFFLKKQSTPQFFVCAFIACCIRETTVLLFPSWILFVYMRDRNLRSIFSVAAGLFLVGIAYLLYDRIVETALGIVEVNQNYMKVSRFSHFWLNFKGKEALFSLASMGNALLLPLGILYIYRKKMTRTHLQWIIPFLVAFILNTAVVIIGTKMRETRLFMLPFVFIWPVMGIVVEEFVMTLKKIESRGVYKGTMMILFLFLIFFISLFLVEESFQFSRFPHLFAVVLLLAIVFMRPADKDNGTLLLYSG